MLNVKWKKIALNRKPCPMLPYLVPMLLVMNRTTDGMTSGDTPDEIRDGDGLAKRWRE